jgi:hypothetical protein
MEPDPGRASGLFSGRARKTRAVVAFLGLLVLFVLAILLAKVTVGGPGAGDASRFAAAAAAGDQVACATATAPGVTVPQHVVGVDGQNVYTIPALTTPDVVVQNCVTTSVATVTVTSTVATTTVPTVVTTTAPSTTTTAADANGNWYSAGSAFNKPIPPGTAYRANEASLINQLVANGPLGPSLGGTPAVYLGDNSTPFVTVYDNHPTCHNQSFQIPIPAGAQSPWGMNHGNVESVMAVMQKTTGTEWDLYHVTAPGEPRLPSSGGVSGDCGSPNAWNAEIVSRFDPGWTGSGNEDCCSGRASKTYQGTGIIRPRDTRMAAGATWGHALVVSYAAELNQAVYPAKGNDGGCTDTSKCVPAGARFQLDPAFPCSVSTALTLEWQRQMCRTLQTYGMIVIDKPCNWPCVGGGIHSENPYGVRLALGGGVDGGGNYRFPYDSSSGYNYMPSALLSQMHVVDWTKWTG